jgi:tRNA modification GTPase
MSFDDRTIFAPATPVGESSITVIRISGKDTFPVISKIFSKKTESFSGLDFSMVDSHTAHHGYVFDGDELIDEVIIIIFKSPNSYTGEDVAEISSHGGRFVFHKLNNLLSKLGIEHSEPGEFSKRAFLNGKFDLVQAEAVSDLIRAKTELSYQAAQKQLTGALSSKINNLRDELINYCSLIELELDFSEEGLEIIDKSVLINKIDKIIQNIDNLANSYETGKIIKDGVNLTITGKPNAGKSSVFNYLLKDSRAIVSEIPGTTRDYIEEPIILGGFRFNLIDTAGIRKTLDIIEKEGVERSYKMIQEADLVLDIIDLSGDLSPSHSNSTGKTLLVYNKADIVDSLPSGKMCISALTGHNIDKLEQKIVQKARSLIKGELSSEILITNERHKNLLLKSCEYLVNAKNLVISNAGNELISIEIREAMGSLNEIIGKTSNVDILNNIFSQFCIGK